MLPFTFTVLALAPITAVAQTMESHRVALASPGGELAFELETILGQPYMISNGAERVRVDAERTLDGWRIPLPPYASTVELVEDERGRALTDILIGTGTWTRTGASGEQVMTLSIGPWPYTIEDGQGSRGPAYALEGAPLDVAGRWRVQFARDTFPAVGIFEAAPDAPGEVRATFITATGDYRYLSGTARGKTLALSCFDGAHAFLFRATLREDGALAGDFWSGATWHETWTAVRDPKAALPDPFGLVEVDHTVDLGELTYPGLDGTPRALKSTFGRVTLVQLFGTWCPNCGDAGLLLRELEREYGPRGLAVVGLAFEHGQDVAAHRARVAAYVERRGGGWPVLLAGPSDKAGARAAFPVLTRVLAYPTTLFVDEDGVVRSVHSGFAGPATGAEHDALRAAFRARIERLLGT